MIPDNVLSSEIVRRPWVYPYGMSSKDFERFELGGITLQDPSQGLRYQTWFGQWNPETGIASLKALTTEQEFPLYTQVGVKEFLFTFDQNMRYVTATLHDGYVCKLRWYDPLVENYVITDFAGIYSGFVRLDDNRDLEVFLGKSDVIFTYISTAGRLCFRTQRERYLIEHILTSDLPPDPKRLRISNFGMNKGLRLQWRLDYRINQIWEV